MKYNIDRTEKYSLATITLKDSLTVTAYITVDIHNERTVMHQAAHSIYGDALLSGTTKKTRAEFLDAVNILGASIGTSISDGTLTISLKSTKDKFSKLLKLTEEMIIDPAFSKSELSRIQKTVINELHEAREDSAAISYSELQNTIYGQNDRKYTYGIEESIKAVDEVKTKHINSLHTDVLSQTWTCSIAADSDSCQIFEKMVSKIKKKTKLSAIVGTHQQKTPQPKAVLKQISSPQNINFNIGVPVPITLHHPDYIALSFGLAVLAKWGGFAGRLMSTVREKEGLTYGIYGKSEGFSGNEQGFLRIMTFFAPDKAVQGLTSTFREITKIYKKGITEEELNKFKTIVSTQQILLNDSVTGLLRDLHAYHCNQFTLKEMDEHKAKVNLLTRKEVNEALKNYLNPSTLTISGAGPVKAVQKDIKKFIKNVQ